MGMSASQARMLSLTSRMSDLEYSAQNISNSKMALATRSQDASKKYLAALDQKKLTVKNPETSAYVDATAANLTTYNAISKMDKQRFIKNAGGQVLISQEVATAYENAKKQASSTGLSDTWLSNFALCETINTSTFNPKNNEIYQGLTTNYINNNYFTIKDVQNLDKGIKSGAEYFLNKFKDSSGNTYSYCPVISTGSPNKVDAAGLSNYDKVFSEMEECGYQVIPDGKQNDSEWLYEQLNNGTVFIAEYNSKAGKDGTGDVVDISWSSGDATLVTENDKTAVARAEAEYEATNAEIATKDKRFDIQLKSIDTEHTAIQTELDSVKKVIDKNIERTFKIFDA